MNVPTQKPHYAFPPLNVPASEETREAHDGYHWEWYPEDDSRAATPAEFCTRKCRRPRCEGEPVMAFRRSDGHWWLYCADHMYGRRITGGVVEFRRLVKDGEDG